MDDGVDIRARPVDLAVNEAFEEKRRGGPADHIAVEIVFENVRRGDERGSERASHEVVLRIAVAADADVAVSVEDFVAGKNAVGEDQILNLIRLCGLRAR